MNVPQAAFRRFVRVNATPTTVQRRDSGTGSNYGEDITYSTLASDRDILVTEVEESRQPTGAGDLQSLSIAAYTEASTDLQVNDRFDHGSRTVEVVSKEGKPNDSNPAIYRYQLEDV